MISSSSRNIISFFVTKVEKLITNLENFVYTFHFLKCNTALRSLEVEVVEVVSLYAEKFLQKNIARLLEITRSVGSKILNRYRETGVYRRRPDQERKSCTNGFIIIILNLPNTLKETRNHNVFDFLNYDKHS